MYKRQAEAELREALRQARLAGVEKTTAEALVERCYGCLLYTSHGGPERPAGAAPFRSANALPKMCIRDRGGAAGQRLVALLMALGREEQERLLKGE